MKDKSKLISSVIVSLLAGFIYYQFSGDVTKKITSSVKAILSENTEKYGPFKNESFTSVVKRNSGKISKNKSKFFIKKNKSGKSEVTDEKQLSEFIINSQAKFKRAVPDRNINFSAELNKLINKNTKDLKGKELESEFKKNRYNNEVADLDENIKEVKMYIKKDKNESGKNGYGFEYNYILKVIKNKSSESGEMEKNYESDNSCSEIKTECNTENCNSTSKKTNTRVVKKYDKKYDKKYEYKTEKHEIILPENELDKETL